MFYELRLGEGSLEYRKIFTFTISEQRSHGYVRLKLERTQELNGGQLTTSFPDDYANVPGSFFNRLWTARKNREGDVYLVFGPQNKMNLIETETMSQL
jgi:hypothetical protein